MKKVLVIILAVLIALTGGVMIYGVTRGTPEVFHEVKKGLLAPPADSIQDGAAHWYSVDTMLSSASSSKQKAANLLVYTTYNHINCKQFYFAAHVDATSGNKYTCSDYYRTQERMNSFYETFAYTGGSLNTAKRRVYYNDQKLEDVTGNVSYDRKTKEYRVTWNDPDVTANEPDLSNETPYMFYSWFDLPIDMGSRQSAYNEIDASLIESASITAPSDSAPYYVVSFTTDIEKMNASEETLRRLKEGTGDVMKDIEILDMTLEYEIWPSGLFRSITVKSRVVAKVSGKKGEGRIDRTYQFSYDDVDCSIAKKFETRELTKFLNDDNKAACQSELAALPED